MDFESVRKVLWKYWGYDDFRPGRANAVSAVPAGRDALVIVPTGGGRSLRYQVPALLLPGVTVVVSPLISLMKDQVGRVTGSGGVVYWHYIRYNVRNTALADIQIGAVRDI